MSLDFRASQGQFNKIIASGSTGTGARLVIYDIRADTAATPNQGTINTAYFGTSGIGQDVFLFVSGGIGNKNSTGQTITVFGGDVHVSGNLSIAGAMSGAAGGTNQIQYNNGSNAFTASNKLWFDNTNSVLGISGSTSISGTLTITSSLNGLIVNSPTSSISGALIVRDQILAQNPQSTTQAAFAFSSSRGTGLRQSGDQLQLFAGGVQVAILEGGSPSMTVPYVVNTVRIQPSSNTMTILGSNDNAANPHINFAQGSTAAATTAITQSFLKINSIFGPGSGVTKYSLQTLEATISQSVGCTGNYAVLTLSSSEVSFQGSTGSLIQGYTNGIEKFRLDSSGTIDIKGGHIYKTTILTSSYTVKKDEYILAVSASTSSSAIITLPSNPDVGRTFIVKDVRGTATANNITITSSAGTNYIDGQDTYIIAINYGSAQFVYFGGPTPGWGII